MRKFLLLTAGVLIAFSVEAQKVKPAFDNLRDGEYEKADFLFHEAAKKSSEAAAAYYGLGMLHFDSLSGRKNNQKAFDEFLESKKQFQKTNAKTVVKIKDLYGIKPSDADSMMRLCALEDFYHAKKTWNDEDARKFLAKYSKTYKDLASSMKYFRDSVRFVLSEVILRLSYKFDNLLEIEKDPLHPFHDSVAPAIRRFQKEEYDYAVKTGSYHAMRQLLETFSEYYPLELNPEDTLKLYSIYLFDSDTSKAKWNEQNLLKKINEFAPTDYAFELLKRLVKPYINPGDCSKAVGYYMKNRMKFPDKQELVDKIIGLLSETPPEFINEQLMPDEINSPLYRNDYGSIMTPDMKTIYFCQDMDFREGDVQEDVYYSKFRNGKWEVSQPLDRFSTLDNNEAVVHIYPDESALVIFFNGQLLISYKQETGTWSEPEPLTSQKNADGESINDFFWQADTYFTSDGQALLFAAGNWDIDIYVCLKQPDGTWGGPVNLGKTVNTDLTDRSPRLAPDLKTLFFTSDGHYGLGGEDIFMTRRLSDTSWTQWSEPVNLGRKINTTDRETFFYMGYDGKTVLYNKGKVIYTAQLPEKFRAQPASVLDGSVTDRLGNPLNANLVWSDLETGTFLGILEADPLTGEFSVTLPLGRDYGYIVEADGYIPYFGVFSNKNSENSKLLTDSVTLFSIQEVRENSVSLELKNIFFDFGKVDLSPESMFFLKSFADFLKNNPDLRVEISGHSDGKGAEIFNQALSLKRAQKVKQELVKLGVRPVQILTKGLGSSQQISDDDSQNRRVEFRILK